MKTGLADDLVCPLSRDPLSLKTGGGPGDVVHGELVCEGCGAHWPIEDRVPRLVPSDLETQQRRTAEAFGWQWQTFSEMHDEYESQFLDWLHPIGREFFAGRRVLDAGCGTGRHARFAAAYGASEVVALDLSDAVETAERNLSGFDNVHVVQGDLLRPPLRTADQGGGFDFVYSIGVLHHLPDPHAGFQSVLRLLRPGGTIAVWVYGHEGNGFVRNVVEPLRRISTKLPHSLLRASAWPLAAAFHVVARGMYRPLGGTPLGRALPLHEYLSDAARFSFRQNYGIVFDQLSAPTKHYIRRSELENRFATSHLNDVQLSSRHGNSSRVQDRMPRAG